MFKRIDHVEVIPADYERTMRFYTEVLGFRLRERKKVGRPPLDEIAYVTLGDTVIEMMSVTNPAPAPTGWRVGYPRIALEVDNMAEAIRYLEGKGVKISVPSVNLGTSLRAEIEDPDGLSIELRQWLRATY